ncbi:MAG: glycosyltransferase family 39 protein [Isosphaeraceae bacterium]|nr:glycosyltransferase family 39 protein [Isosphaeraceae bacterium]
MRILRAAVARHGLAVATSAAILGAAILHLGCWLWIGLDRDDAGHLESTFVLPVARQVRDGFGVLYGPYSGANPLVMIHAPLYYRLAALSAYLVMALRLDAESAALVVGRLLSLLATLGLFAMADRLACLDGAPRRAGLWAAALIAASPVLGCLAVMVRPDTLGTFLQTAGALLTLRALRDGACTARRLAVAYLAFGLALCVKQHDGVVLAVTSLILLGAYLAGQARFGPVAMAHFVGLGVVGLYYGAEHLLTDGLTSRTVFVLPSGAFRTINRGAWPHVLEVGQMIARKSLGLIALGAACGALALMRGTLRRLDALLLAYLVAEVASLVPLCYYNSGAADNYALQAIVFASVLIGRALERLFSGEARVLHLLPVGAAALLLLAADSRQVGRLVSHRRADRAAVGALLAAPEVAGCPAEERYFTVDQRLNRLHGRRDLVHDEMLYTAYELADAAEPRARWLRAVLLRSVRQVIVPDDAPTVPGVAETLPELGYARTGQHGEYRVWERRRNMLTAGVR